MFYHGFFLLFFFPSFRRLISELAERNSTKIGHLLGSNCDLETHVQKLGISSPTNRGTKTTFWTTSQLNSVDNYEGLLYRPKMSWTLVHQRFQTGPPFYPPYENSAFYVIARLRRRRSANKTQPNFGKRRMVNRANGTGRFTHPHYFVPSQSIAHPLIGINVAPHSVSK